MCSSRIPRCYPTAVPLKKMKVPTELRKYMEKAEPTHSETRWLCWLQENDNGGILARTFAFKKNKKYGMVYYECMREDIGRLFMLRRNIWYTQMVGWQCYFPAENEIISEDWTSFAVDDMPGMFIEVLNTEVIAKSERFKHSGWQNGLPALEYLRAYYENPGVEFFGKLGIMPKKSLIQKAIKDGNFRRWLRDLPKNIPGKFGDINAYGPKAFLDAYRAHTFDVGAAYWKAYEYRQACSAARGRGGRLAVEAGWDPNRVLKYLNEKKSRDTYYGDYLTACKYLGLDLKDTKNVFPVNLKRMHDLRIDEMNSKKAKLDLEKKTELDRKFYKAYQRLKWCETDGEALCIIIPSNPIYLQREGIALHHCVGKMGYDVKMADGKSFIAFVRKTEDKDKPFVTVEFDLYSRSVRQCYGDHDSRPDYSVKQFVNEWAEMVRRKLVEEETRKRKEEAEETKKNLLEKLKHDVPEVAAG